MWRANLNIDWGLLTHWGRVTHICVGKLTIIGSDNNGLSPGRPQPIIWTNAGILLIEPLGTNFSEILIGIQIFSFKKMCLKISSAKWRPFCLGLNVLNCYEIQVSCNAMYGLPFISKTPLTVPSTALMAGILPAIRAVQGDCEIV